MNFFKSQIVAKYDQSVNEWRELQEGFSAIWKWIHAHSMFQMLPVGLAGETLDTFYKGEFQQVPALDIC